MATKFGKYIQQKRLEKFITLRSFAERVDIAAGYVSDIENGNKLPPEKDILNKMIQALNLTDEEADIAYDLAAQEKGTIAQDIPIYIKENEVVVRALRTARANKASIAEWEDFIKKMESKKDNEEAD